MEFDGSINDIAAYKNCAIYSRVSSKMQVGKGHVSLETQTTSCRDFADSNNLTVIRTAGETASASRNGNRGALSDLLKLKNTVIIVFDVSRFSRSLMNALTLINKFRSNNNIIWFVHENISSESPDLVIHLERAEEEGKAIGRRMSDAKKEKARRGYHTSGHIPYGKTGIKTDSGTILEDNEHEKNILKFVRTCMRAPVNLNDLNNSLRRIVDDVRIVDDEPVLGFDKDGETLVNVLRDPLNGKEIAYNLNDYGVQARVGDWTSAKVYNLKKYFKNIGDENEIENEVEVENENENEVANTMINIDKNTFDQILEYQKNIATLLSSMKLGDNN